MKHDDLSGRWKGNLKTYLQETLKEDRDQLLATDFNVHYSVKIDFEDSSSAFFRYAFYLIDEASNDFAVFTEHCGYHVFPLTGTQLELLESKRSEYGE